MSLARTEEAISAYRRAIQLRPDYADAHFNLGAAQANRGDMEGAVAAFQIGLRFMPQLAEGYHCLGNALAAMGRLDEAIAAFRSALQLEPGLAKVHNDLGVLLAERGQPEQAINSYRHALELQPDLPEIHNNLGNALRNQGRIEEAIAAHRRAIETKQDYAEAHNNLGVDLQDKGVLDEADAAFRLAIRHKPDYAEAHSNLGNLLKDLARFDEALGCYRLAVSLRPENAGLHSNLIYASLFHPDVDAPTVREEGARWERQHAPHSAVISPRRGNRPDALRRLKVGYVSPDFRHHVISHFLTPLLESHHHTQFEIHCYSSVGRPDAFTDRLLKSADHWEDVRGIRDETLAEMIRADGIDILVDLTQHMADNRLPLFARKPAPVQVAWLGYPGSTGLSAIDYRFTDASMEPQGSTWSESVETPVRLPDSWFCFDPLDEYPEPSPLPALAAGHVTFGSLNNFCKVNDGVLQLWTRVLQAVEGSRLLMQCPVGSAQERVRNWFEVNGIAAHRLDLVSKTRTRAEFLRLFERFDIALETFPYNGGTTTCEALWMGIPVPTFPGTTAVSRIGLSILSAAGLQEFVAAGQEDYVRLVTGLASDLPRLAALRSTLRQRIKASAFMDAPRFARNVENAYRQMWPTWCSEQKSGTT